MPESLTREQDKTRNELLRFISFGTCVAIYLIVVYMIGFAPVKTGELYGSDCYLRLLRVESLWSGDGWYNLVFRRINPPYGQTSHWTRPFDVLLMAGAAPISLFTDFKTALFWWGVIISPVLMIATLVAFQWSAKPVLKKDGPFLAGLVFIFQAATLACYQAARPDHQSLLVLMFVLSVGLALRMVIRPVSVRLCYIAGIVSGISAWISIESMVTTFLILSMLGLFWVLDRGDYLRKSLHYAVSLFVAAGLSIVCERPWSNLLAEEYDCLSIVHLSIFGFIAAMLIVLSVLDCRTQLFRMRASRLWSAPVFSLVMLLTVFIIFPKFYKGPFVDYNPRLIPILFSKIDELWPLVSRDPPLVTLTQVTGLTLAGIPFLYYLIRNSDPKGNQKGWIFLLLASVVYMPISVYQRRWSVYLQLLLTIPVAHMIFLVRQRGPMASLLRTLKNIAILAVFSIGLLSVGLLLAVVIERKGRPGKTYKKANLVQICDYLTKADELKDRSLLILAHVRFGAEILYRTDHSVLCTQHATGTPHRGGQGVWDNYSIMVAETDEEAREIMQRRKVDLILLCPESNESAFYSRPGASSTFYQSLLQGRIPYWLRKVELPADLALSFQLFRADTG